MYKKYLKRVLGVVLAVIAGVILLIPMLIISVLIKIDSKGPVLFKQERLGLNGEVFYIYKFRTMCVGAEKVGTGVYSEKGDPRVTKIGAVLRNTSLDEIPQVFNILNGTMQWIGPRAPLTYHPFPLEEYTDEQKRIFEVRPGITGWAQVNGRKAVEWDERFKMNVWYVDNVTFFLDIKIIFMTFFKVITNVDNENSGATV